MCAAALRGSCVRQVTSEGVVASQQVASGRVLQFPWGLEVVLLLTGCCGCWLSAAAGKLDQAQELSGHLAAAYPGNPSVNMLQAVLLAKSGKVCFE